MPTIAPAYLVLRVGLSRAAVSSESALDPAVASAVSRVVASARLGAKAVRVLMLVRKR